MHIQLQGQLIGIVGGRWNPGPGEVLTVSPEVGARHVELGNAVPHVETPPIPPKRSRTRKVSE